MKKEKPKYSIVNNIIFLLKDMWKEYPLLIFYFVLWVVCYTLSPLFGMLLPKITLDLVETGAGTKKVLCVLGGFGIAMVLSMALLQMASWGRYMMYNNMRTYYQKKLFYRSLYCDYRIIGSAEGQKRYQRAYDVLRNGDWSATSKMTVKMLDMLVTVLSFGIYSGVIAVLHPGILALLLALSYVQYAAAKRARAYEQKHRFEGAEINRRVRYLDKVNDDMSAGKDIRLYHMQDWFLNIWDICIKEKAEWQGRMKARHAAAGALGEVLFFLRDSVAYLYLIWAVDGGRLTAGDFVLYFAAIIGFSGFMSRFVSNLNELHSANHGMNDMRAFLDEEDEPEPENPVDISTLTDRTIEFRDVSFAYQKGGEPTLSHISFVIRPEEKIALVGVNGAGKTTIVKLLCGFYRPDSGQILLGGADIRRFRREDLYTFYSAVFQDIYLPPYSVAQNVSLKTAEETDTARVEECLKRAGLYERISQEKRGIYEAVGRVIEEGIMFSGGQKQKLLLARALYKDAPVLILDEPTAALDPIAESETYEAFWQLARKKTAIFISHRLASTRFCDRILLLSGGRIAESGTHEELVARGGEYARMFEVQSQYYAEAGGAAYE